MSFADSNRVSLRVFKETVWGETPVAPAMSEVRYTGESLNHTVETVDSQVIRSDRMRDDNLLVGVSAEGNINVELVYGDLDVLLQAALNGVFTPAATAGATITVAAAGKTFTRGAGSFITDGFTVGAWMNPSGFVNAGNNKYFRITIVTALVVTVEDPEALLVDEVGPGGGCGATGDVLRNGGTLQSLLIEKAFLDINKFIYFNGMRVDKMNLAIIAKEIVKGDFTLMGKQGVSGAATISGSVAAAGTKTALTASANVGHLVKDGVSLAASIKSLSVASGNNLRQQPKVGQSALAGVGAGFFELTGTMELYLEDLTIYALMESHTPMALSLRFTDAAGHVMIFTMPKIYLNKSTANATGGNSDVMLTCEVTAVRDPLSNCLFQIDKF